MLPAAALAGCALLAQVAVPAREASLEKLRAAFPQRWELPDVDAEGQPLPSQRFEARVGRLATQPLADSGSAGDATPMAGTAAGRGDGALMLGDLVRACQEAGWEPGAVRVQVARVRGDLSDADVALLETLLLCDGILDPKWRPSRTKRVGIAFGPTWSMPEGSWIEHDGTRTVEQAATLIVADPHAIKAAEHDYASYFDFPDHEYLEIVPRPGRHLRVADEDGRCRAVYVDVYFETDLPFPFTRYSYDLGILHRSGDDGEDLVSFVYGRGTDLHWLAGRDRYWTVRDGDGAPVAMLLARQLAIDLDGRPDRISHRREGMREGLGNLRREAERRFDGEWAPQPGDGAGVPEFRVIAPE